MPAVLALKRRINGFVGEVGHFFSERMTSINPIMAAATAPMAIASAGDRMIPAAAAITVNPR